MRRLKVFSAMVLATVLGGCSNAPVTLPSGGPVKASQCLYSPAGEPSKPVDPPQGNDVPNRGELGVTLKMTEGEINIVMDRSNAPCAVNSFEALATQKYFDDTSCHRLTESGIFILQCGDPTGTGHGGPGYVFADEVTGRESYTAGTVAMANSGSETNGSQFFIVWADSSTLGPEFTILGHIDEASLEVVRSIAAQGIDAENPEHPLSPAKIESVVMG